MEKVQAGGQRQDVTPLDLYHTSEAYKELEHVEKVLKAMGDVRVGEKGTFGETFQPSGGWLGRKVREWDFTGGYLSGGSLRFVRKVWNLEDCSTQVASIDQVVTEFDKCIRKNINYLNEQTDAQVAKEISRRINNLYLLTKDSAEVGLKQLAENYTKPEDKRKVEESIAQLSRTVFAGVRMFMRSVSELELPLFLNSLKSAEVFPSNLVLVNETAQCILKYNTAAKAFEFVENPEEIRQFIIQNEKEMKVIAKPSTDSLEFQGLIVKKGDESNHIYCFIDPYRIGSLQFIGHKGPSTDLAVLFNNNPMDFPVPSYRKIMEANSEYIKKQSTAVVDLASLNTGFDPKLWEKNMGAVFSSFHTLKPLDINKDNIKVLEAIGKALESPGVLEQCRAARDAHSDWS